MQGLALFGPLEPATEAALRASIERFGVLVPVTFDQRGRILDGHHRWRIASELGVDCPYGVRRVESDDEAAELARTLNMDRRHLDPSLRRKIAVTLRVDGHNLRAIAQALGVNASTIWRDVSGVAPATPDRVLGRDHKLYPATRAGPVVPVKPDLGEGISHPARFGSALLVTLVGCLFSDGTWPATARRPVVVLDPFRRHWPDSRAGSPRRRRRLHDRR